MEPSLLILGASTRAAAFSALRAGLQVECGDLFADADLAARCRVRRAERYPSGLIEIANRAPAGPWMYTGALENHPQIVSTISRERELWGNPAEVLRKVRDPFQLAAALREADLPACDVRGGDQGAPAGRWLCKRIRSSGGIGIRWADPLQAAPKRGEFYWQRYIPGHAQAGLFVAAGGKAALLAVTEQYVGEARFHAAPFRYCGSLGPLPLSPAAGIQWQRVGDAVAARFELRGLFGIDAVVNDEGIWPVEVNPRYTASMEVVEAARNDSLVALNVAACREGALPHSDATPSGMRGKAVLFAPRGFHVSAELTQNLLARNQAGTLAAADIPPPGTPIRAGSPICTLFANGKNATEVNGKLSTLAAEFYARWP